MTDTKEKSLYFIDRLVLSAFRNSDEAELLEYRQEEEKLRKVVDKKFITSLDKKLASVNLELETGTETQANAYLVQNKHADALNLFVQLYEKEKKFEYVKHIGHCLLHLEKAELINKYYIKELLKHVDDDIEVLRIVATTFFAIPECQKKAIGYYEKLVQLEKNCYTHFYQLSYLYERVYQNKYLDKQLEYAKKALELAPRNNFVLAFVAKICYRSGDKTQAKKYFEQIMKNNPTPEQQVLYSRYFMKEGEFEKGYDLYRIRFRTSNVAYPKELTEETRWDGKKDISNSTVILHYEQGFGDSVMFSRYIPRLSKLAKKVIFVVQKNLIPIFKASGFDEYCEILSHEADVNKNITLKDTNSSVMYTDASGMSRIPHDYHLPLMDLPYIFKEAPDKMYEAEGYLKVDEAKLEKFRKKYINKNNKIKIGLSYHGTNQSIQTYRDLKVKEFLPLFRMKDVEFYSFQADEYAKELEKLPKDVKVINLGKSFKNFEDTACAMKCMDLVISTDNVVMNLAGALGVKTFGIFNVFTEARWYKTTGEDIGWYKSIKPFQAKDFNDWQPVIENIKQEILKMV